MVLYGVYYGAYKIANFYTSAFFSAFFTTQAFLHQEKATYHTRISVLFWPLYNEFYMNVDMQVIYMLHRHLCTGTSAP